ncbi:class I SAM-dependent methyltransferase [Niveispirillum fermenti]|uniref:class I SAM-dependent methyltransferase n=1 Tax=Niveispirillum fermenti TaxID=1233113 RepID=UPI003A84A2F5
MEFIWQSEDSPAIAQSCPVCGHGGGHRPVVVLPRSGPGGADWVIVQCAGCATRFSTDRQGADYHGDDLPNAPLLHFYLEQGAGLRPMLEPLGFVEPGEGRRMLEIGGGFGFVSDFTQEVFGWTAKGYDPSGLATLGRDYLGLDITRDYWTADTPMTQPFDIAYASEVVEHIPEPGPFLAAMRRAVGDQGMAVLTTPDGAALNPLTSPAMLAPIASPGLHLTLFSAAGLEHALRAAGFTQIRVEAVGCSLHAFASNAPLPPPRLLDAAHYHRYLRQRIASPDLAPALLSGLRYRLMKDMVNGGDPDEALALFEEIAAAHRQRFGIDITRPQSLMVPDAGLSTEQWLSAMPGNVAGLLYFRAVLANNVQGDAQAAALFAGKAALMGAGLRRALHKVGMEDGETEVLCMAAINLFMTAAVGCGADVAPLLTAVEEGAAADGLLLPDQFRRTARATVCRDLRNTRNPNLLWQGVTRVEAAEGEVALLERLLRADIPAGPVPAFTAIEQAADAAAVRAALDAIWVTPGAAEAPASIRHARKLALIRLVLLGAFAEAEHLFAAWDTPKLAEDEPVAQALAIAASAKG